MFGVVGRRSANAVAAVATLALSAPAFAEGRSFSLAYSAPAGCPARDTVVASIRARAPGSTEDTLREAELAFDIALEPALELTRGTLRVRFASGERFEREVPAAACADVTTTMAIMAGLLLSGALRPEPPPAPVAEPVEPAAPVEPPVRSPAVVRSVPSEARPLTVPPPAGRRAPLGRLRVGATLHGELGLGALPFPTVGGSVGLAVGVERASWFAPSLRAGFLYLTATAAEPPLGDAHFALAALFVRLCPLRVELGAPLAVGACALLEAGSLDVGGRSTRLPAERSMGWVALGPALRLSARTSPWLSLEAEARGFGLLRHDRFVLQPGNVQVHEIPAVAAGLALGVLVELP